MIVAEKISVIRGRKKVLHPLSFHLRAGEFVAVCGPNGAGKTTLLKVLAGNLLPTTGNIMLNGVSLAHYSASALAANRAVMSQREECHFPFTATEMVEFGMSALPRTACHSNIVDEVMNETGMSELAPRLFLSLSGGEAQRVQLSRALAQLWPKLRAKQPCVLMLDEPTASLDLRHQFETLKLCKKFSRQGAAVFCIVHDLNLAAHFADRLIVLCKGQLRANDKTESVLKNTQLLSDIWQCDICPMEWRGVKMVVTHPSTHA